MSMLFQDAPVNTLAFMIAGFGVILGAMVLFVVSLIYRFSRLKRDLAHLRDIEVDDAG
jgi:hypothetical protein